MAVRRGGMVLAVLSVPLVLAAPVSPAVRAAAHPVVREAVVPATGTDAYADGRCGDTAGTWMGARWREPMRWRFDIASAPAYLGDAAAVRDVVRRAAANIDLGRNPCGLAENLDIAQGYESDTGRTAGVTPDGTCAGLDGANTVSFGTLPAGTLAVTCTWWVPGRGGADGRAVEADILVNDAVGLFAPVTAAATSCSGQWDLESALTHEFGHAFGLGHVSSATHPGLTMSDGLAPCDFGHRGLGLGDYAMLRARYGAG